VPELRQQVPGRLLLRLHGSGKVDGQRLSEALDVFASCVPWRSISNKGGLEWVMVHTNTPPNHPQRSATHHHINQPLHCPQWV
jgi:hypothetical protein